jgi:hypothetical protein
MGDFPENTRGYLVTFVDRLLDSVPTLESMFVK